MDLGQELRIPWTLVGGQMVLLHALEHGFVPPQVSQDGDIVADVRALRGAIARVVAELERLDFRLDGMSPDGLAHRYVRPAQAGAPPGQDPLLVKVDVLAPEGLGARADLTTTRPGRTIEVPGGTQALRRTESVNVLHDDRSALVPRPTLLGALVGKGAACGLPGDAARHLRDLALLCALVEDPFELADDLSRKDRKRLRKAGALHDEAHAAWQLVPSDVRERGYVAFRVLTAD